jgi:hypothetical protein
MTDQEIQEMKRKLDAQGRWIDGFKDILKDVQAVSGTINTGDPATDTAISSLIESYNKLIGNIGTR